MLDEDLPISQQELEELDEEFSPSEDYIEKGDEEKYRRELNQKWAEHQQEINKIRLHIQLMDILKELRRTYHIPHQTNLQTKKILVETQKEARDMIRYQTTTYTFKFFYILSIVTLGFFLRWLYYEVPLHATCFIGSFFFGFMPLKNIIYLPKPSKYICDLSDRIENFIWKKKEIFNKDVIEMNKLVNNKHRLMFRSDISKVLNVVIALIVLFVSMSIDIFPHASHSSETINSVTSANYLLLNILIVPSTILIAVLTFELKMWCFRKIIQYQFYPEILLLLY